MDKAVYEKKLLADIIDSIEKHGGKDCLSSIILTGSFGRDEPTYIFENSKEMKLKSDVEIALIFSKLSLKNTICQMIQSVSSEFEEDLNLMAISEVRVRKAYNFNFSLKKPKYKTIFTYDFFNGSKTIWGRDFIGEKNITLNDVDLYEAKRLVANRIGELTYLQMIGQAEQKDYLRKQWKGKLVLAIASSWLICEGEYVSSYHGQYDKLSRKVVEAEKVIGKGFYAEYNKVFLFLRESGKVYEVSDDALTRYVKNMDQYFREKKINRSKVNSVSRNLKYSLKYLKTGMKYGILGFENNILQALIVDFWKQSDKLGMDANVWYKVLY